MVAYRYVHKRMHMAVLLCLVPSWHRKTFSQASRFASRCLPVHNRPMFHNPKKNPQYPPIIRIMLFPKLSQFPRQFIQMRVPPSSHRMTRRRRVRHEIAPNGVMRTIIYLPVGGIIIRISTCSLTRLLLLSVCLRLSIGFHKSELTSCDQIGVWR